MRYFGLLFIIAHAVAGAKLMTINPSIVDKYTIHTNLKNPYNGNVTDETIMIEMSSDTPIDVYNLNLDKIKEIHTINIECYGVGDCDSQITIREQKYLSLYASMIEMCGVHSIHQTYSIGVLRNLHQENVMGKFTKTEDFNGNLLHMSFWIRLTTGRTHYVYDDLDSYALTVAMMEMSVHERAHYDVTTYDTTAGHCDEYQMWYNSLIQSSIRDLDRYNRLTIFVMGNGYQYVSGLLFILVLFCIFSLCLCDFTRGRNVREKRIDTV